jgi:hypothetical protein
LMAVYATMFMGIQPLGALMAGGVGHRLGTTHTVLLFGSVVLLGCIVFIWRVLLKGSSAGATPAANAA